MKITDELLKNPKTNHRNAGFTDEEREKTKQEINKIVEYMDILNELDTTNIEAMSHAFPVRNVFREDIVQPSVNREDIILNAANKKEGCFKVPKAVE